MSELDRLRTRIQDELEQLEAEVDGVKPLFELLTERDPERSSVSLSTIFFYRFSRFDTWCVTHTQARSTGSGSETLRSISETRTADSSIVYDGSWPPAFPVDSSRLCCRRGSVSNLLT